MRILFAFFALVIITSCISSKIKYSEKKIYKLEENGYSVHYSNENIKFKNILLDRKNIKSVNKDRTEKTLNILSKDLHPNFITGEILYNQIKKEANQNFDLIVINGIPFSEQDLKFLKIEKSIYKDYIILPPEKLNSTIACRQWQNGFLILNLK